MSLSDQLGFSFKPPERRVWNVRDLVAAVRTHIEREYNDIWVEGEISNFRAHDSGHLYVTLKDQNSQMRVVMFRSQARLLRFRPEDGMQIVARGRVTITVTRGRRVVRRFRTVERAGGRTFRFSLSARGLPRGDFTVRLVAQAGEDQIVSLLTARRL